MSVDCVVDAQGCIVCPPIAAVASQPARTLVGAVVGWNAGANSVALLSGDLHTQFQISAGSVGVLIGFRKDRTFQTIPTLIAYGLFFDCINGIDFVTVMENGVPMTTAATRAGTDTFDIRRVGSQVSYWNGSTRLYTSTQPSYDVLSVNACLYASGDTIE